eukprot:4339332-Amphidinium_carterae.1
MSTSQVQKFMSTLTEMAHQGKGNTVLYIPQDNFSSIEAVSKDKDSGMQAAHCNSNQVCVSRDLDVKSDMKNDLYPGLLCNHVWYLSPPPR